MLLPLFAKATEYKDQREYRFAIFTETEPAAETVFLTASPALTGAMGQVVPTGGPQIMPPAEYLEDETGEAKEDDVDNECDDRTDQSEVNLVDLIDQVREESDGLHAFRQHAFDLASDPATVLRPNKLDPAAALLEEVAALTDTYPAVQALRSKVHEVRTAADLSPQQKAGGRQRSLVRRAAYSVPVRNLRRSHIRHLDKPRQLRSGKCLAT